MNRLIALATVISALAVLATGIAQGDPSEYGIKAVSASTAPSEGGKDPDEAGGHPDFTMFFELKTEHEEGKQLPSTTEKTSFALPPGLLGNPNAVKTCTAAQLVNTDPEVKSNETGCPQDSQIGVSEVYLFKNGSPSHFLEPVYNMEPGPGEPARFGLFAEAYPIFIDTELRSAGRNPDYGATAKLSGVSSYIPLLSANTTIWGVPADKSHDTQRLTAYEAVHAGHPETATGKRESGEVPTPFMLNPTRCGVAQEIKVTTVPYAMPSLQAEATASLKPNTGCGSLEFKPDLSIEPTSEAAEAGTGLNVKLSFPTDGFKQTNLLGEAAQRKAEVVLPEGMSINPSQAEGLQACSEAAFERETATGAPNEGCPEAAKIGSATANSPLLDEPAEGSLYVAEPFKNPFNTLIAVYMVLRVPDRGVVVRLAGKVIPDPNTGQLVTTFDDIPQLPVSNFLLHFREGARSPLVTPSRCGTYTSTATFTSWSGKVAVEQPSFDVTRGANGASCPSGELPLHPDFVAGTINNAAGKYSPFSLRLSREDGEQEISRFSAQLPRGLVGKLAGVSFCPDAAIAAAKTKSGASEEASPSCPPGSELGHTLAGAGAGSALTYVPGKVYLAGPYQGALLSIVAITAAKVGPFDLGTVVVREALRVDPESAQVTIDPTGSDPLPHIIAGIPTHLRDLRVYTDRPQFVLNPTSCKRMSVLATVFGPGPSFASPADDRPANVSTPFQAADCAALAFKPKLKLSLRGGTHRGAHPSLKGVLTMKPGEAGIARTQIALPRSEFIENAHFKTICTRVQFAAGKVPGEACPPGSIYGHAKATTPLLSEPLSGPVYLRSSNHELPDMVIALNSKVINIDTAARIDSTRDGGIRATFSNVPDAPVSKVIISMRGAKKGLIVNSTNVCKGRHLASADLGGQNGKTHSAQPELKAECK